MRDAFDDSVALTDSFVAFYDSSHSVERGEFSTYAIRMLKNYPYVRFAGWLPYVSDADRKEFEADAQKDLPGFHLQDLTAAGLIPATESPEYFPVFFAEPDKSSGKFLGFNVLTDPQRKEALEKARTTRQIAVSGRIALLSNKIAGIVFYAPVYDKIDKNKLQGMISITIPIAQIIELAIKPLSSSGVNIIVDDLSAGGNQDDPIYIHYANPSQQNKPRIINDYHNAGKIKDSSIINVAGRKWKITVLADGDNFLAKNDRDSVAILLGGIIFTALITLYMLSRVRENERINQTVHLRTQELNHTKKEIESILNSTTEGVIGIDETGKVIFCNPVSLFLLGYNYGDLINKSYKTTFYQNQPNSSQQGEIENVIKAKKISATSSEEVFWRKDGDPVHVEYTASAIIDETKISGAVIIFRDVTKRKLNEERLHQLAHHDQLTDVANRSLFFELLKKSLARTPPHLIPKSPSFTWISIISNRSMIIWAMQAVTFCSNFSPSGSKPPSVNMILSRGLAVTNL